MIKKKVIIIGPSYPLRGGISDSNHSLGLALQKLGCEVKILSFSLQYPSLLFPGKTQFDTNGIKPKLSIFSKINSINPFSWVKAAFWLHKQQPDFIITRFWIPFIGFALGTILRLFAFKNSSDLKKIYGEEDSIVSHIIIFNILCLSFLIIFHLFFNISSMIFYTIMMALTLSLNIVISNFFRRRNYILLYSMFLNSPFIIATAGLFFLPIINSFTAINIYLGAFYLLIIFELFFLKFYFKFNFFEKINFRNILI